MKREACDDPAPCTKRQKIEAVNKTCPISWESVESDPDCVVLPLDGGKTVRINRDAFEGWLLSYIAGVNRTAIHPYTGERLT
jgi:hypothetical protein